MKEALMLITGQPRFTDISSSNVKRNVLDALILSGFRVRVVTALWDSNSYDRFKTTVGDNTINHMLHTFEQDNDIGYDQFLMQIKIEKTVMNP